MHRMLTLASRIFNPRMFTEISRQATKIQTIKTIEEDAKRN